MDEYGNLPLFLGAALTAGIAFEIGILLTREVWSFVVSMLPRFLSQRGTFDTRSRT